MKTSELRQLIREEVKSVISDITSQIKKSMNKLIGRGEYNVGYSEEQKRFIVSFREGDIDSSCEMADEVVDYINKERNILRVGNCGKSMFWLTWIYPKESNLKESKFTLTKGNETATIEYSNLTKEWYASLKKGGKTIYSEFRAGYYRADADGNKLKSYDGNIPAEKWKDMPEFKTLATLYKKVKDKVKFTKWGRLTWE